MKLKTFFNIVICFLLVFLLTNDASAAELPSISAECAILTDGSGNVLYAENADKKMLIASTTKIMTALVVLENSELDETVIIKPEHTSVEGSSMYLKNGEEVTVRELLHGLILASGNDAASALAYHVGGSIEKFSDLMNEKAKDLGLKNTSFANPHGLDHDGHYSTAKDLSAIMVEAMKNEEFRRISSLKSVKIGGRTLKNHNKLLSICDGVIGGKTGYTKSAGRTLVSCCRRNGFELYCVTLNAPDDWNDHSSLYDWAFEEFEKETVADKYKLFKIVPVISGKKEKVSVYPKETSEIIYNTGQDIKIRTILPKFVYAPITEGSTAGRIDIYIDNVYYDSISLVYGENVQRFRQNSNVFNLFKFRDCRCPAT